MPANIDMEKIVSLCKRRGFVFPAVKYMGDWVAVGIMVPWGGAYPVFLSTLSPSHTEQNRAYIFLTFLSALIYNPIFAIQSSFPYRRKWQYLERRQGIAGGCHYIETKKEGNYVGA